MADRVPPRNNNATTQPLVMAPGPVVQQVPAPQGAYYHGLQSSPRGAGVNEGFNASVGVWTGGIQLACGVVLIFVGFINISLIQWGLNIGTGVWAGAVFVSTGILGILTKRRKQCVIVGYMVMSILSSVLAGIALILFIDEAVYISYSHRGGRVFLSVLSFLCGFTELVVAIVAASFCCCTNGKCCASQPAGPAQVVYYYQAMPAGYVMPQGMVAFGNPTQQTAPGAPVTNSYVQQPIPMAQYPPGGQPPMHWQPTASGQPAMGQQAQANPTDGRGMAQAPGVEKPPPYI